MNAYLIPAAAACWLWAGLAVAADDGIEYFEKRVRPLLVNHCVACHGPEEASGGLRLDSRASWQAGSENGPVLMPGKPDESRLIRAVRYTDPRLQMPPPDEGGRLTDRQIADLVTWVTIGAPDPRDGRPAAARDFAAASHHWAFQPVRRVEPPEGMHPVDYFVDRRLAREGYAPLPRADRDTLVRRATYNLHGLPPSTEQLAVPTDQFAALVDTLLDSPRYGERWGRHWLDVARFADTKDGVQMYGDHRIRAFAYTYRDYVIRSFNEDKPFDRFIHEQIAADHLGLDANAPELAAMGLLTLGRMFDANVHDVIDDRIDTITRGLLGLTVSCARCHDHKYDPIPTTDYYSLHGVFANSVEPLEWPRIEDPTPDGEEFERQLAEKEAEIRKLQSDQRSFLMTTAR